MLLCRSVAATRLVVCGKLPIVPAVSCRMEVSVNVEEEETTAGVSGGGACASGSNSQGEDISPPTKSRPRTKGLILFDAHSHIHDERSAPFLDELLANSGKLGVGCVALNGTSPDDWERVGGLSSLPDLWHTDFTEKNANRDKEPKTNPLRKLAEEEKMSTTEATTIADESVLPYIECDAPLLLPSFGVHPYKIEQALQFQEEEEGLDWKQFLRQMLEAHPFGAVGEIGLHNAGSDNAPMEKQMEVFEQQLEIAAEFQRPVTIHCVKAYGKVLDALKKYKPPKVMLHSFAGGMEMIQAFERLEDVEVYYSYSGNITHPNHKKARDSVPFTPIEKLLIESDSPDQIPRNPLFSGNKLNEPGSCRVVLDTVARLRSPFAVGEELSIAEKHSHNFHEECISLAKTIFSNSCRFFDVDEEKVQHLLQGPY